MPSTKTTVNKRKRLLIAAAITASGALIYLVIPKGESPKKAEQNAASLIGTAPKDFHGIPPEGIGGDPLLNKQKNRWSAPAEVTTMTVSQIINLPHDELSKQGAKDRVRWSSAAAAQASESENKGVQVEGYLAKVRESDEETANGKNPLYHDFHLWITEFPAENKNNGIVVEAIPFWKEYYSGWQLHAFEKIALKNAKVRVTGWIFWDQEHGSEVGKSRGSIWEVHPITKFEVFEGGKWLELNAPTASN